MVSREAFFAWCLRPIGWFSDEGFGKGFERALAALKACVEEETERTRAGVVELKSGARRVRRERGEPGILVREVAAHFDPGANRARGEVEVIAEEGAAKGW